MIAMFVALFFIGADAHGRMTKLTRMGRRLSHAKVLATRTIA